MMRARWALSMLATGVSAATQHDQLRRDKIMGFLTPQRSLDRRALGDRRRRALGDRRGKVAVALIVILVLAAAGFALYWFMFRGAGHQGDAATQLFARLPTATTRVVIRPGKILESEFVNSLSGMVGGGGGGIPTLRAEIDAKLGFAVTRIEALAIAIDVDYDGLALVLVGDVDVASGPSVLSLLETQFGVPIVSGVDGGARFIQVDDTHVVGGFGTLGDRVLDRFQKAGADPAIWGLRNIDAERGMIAVVDTNAAAWGIQTFPKPVDILALVDLPPVPIPGMADVGRLTAMGFSVNTTDALDAVAGLTLDRPAKGSADFANTALGLFSRLAGGAEKSLLKTLDIHAEDDLLIVRAMLTSDLLDFTFGGSAGGGGSLLPWLNF
ncbi:MAG: hypothetical protein ACI9MR_001662 [Myxococcota bacterium]|jgi:hypothetical protein